MRTEYSGNTVRGSIVASPSEGQTIRSIFLASMAFGKSAVRNPLLSDAAMSLIEVLRTFNVPIDERNGDLYITGGYLRAPAEIDCRGQDIVAEYMASFCSIFHKQITLKNGKVSEPLFKGLEGLGVITTSDPVTVKGPMMGGETLIEGDSVSDSVSSLMMTAPFLKDGVRIRVEGDMISRPGIMITENIMSKFGVSLFYEENSIRIAYGGYKPFIMDISGDYLAASYPMAAAALSGNVSVYGLDQNDLQGEKAIERILREAGADVSRVTNATVVKQGSLMGRNIDVSNIPKLIPLLAVLFSSATGRSKLYGIAKSDMDLAQRTCEMIASLGGTAEIDGDSCDIIGTGHLKGGNIDPKGNAYIAMAAATASVICDGPVLIDNTDCILCQFPNFNNDLRAIGLKVEEKKE